MRAAVALSVLSMVAGACSQQQQQATTRTAVHSGYQRPVGYDPPGPSHDPWGPWIREASRRYDVPERWIREVMRQESGGRVGATSPVGAMGLMQVMPGTYRELRNRHGLGNDPYHPYDSIMAGTAYIREMYDLYGSPAFLAAYNAGPRRLEDYLWNSRGLPAETRNYVRRIGPNIIAHNPHRRVAPEVYAAAEIPLDIPAGPRRMDGATMLALREQRQAVDPGVQVARLAPGPVVRMEPIPDGSTYGDRYQVAALGGPVVRMDPIPDGSTYGSAAAPPAAPAPSVGAAPVPATAVAAAAAAGGGVVVRMDPIPDGATPEGAARLAAEARAGRGGAVDPTPAFGSSLAVATLPPPAPRGGRGGSSAEATGTRYAALAAPVVSARRGTTAAAPAAASRFAAAPVVVARASAAPAPPVGARTVLAASLSPAASRPPAGAAAPRGFGLVGTAQAATLRPAVAQQPAAPAHGGGGAWAVQVGAFSTEAQARAAAAAAGGGRVAVQPVAQGRTTLYRARLTGLSQPAARQLCDRLRGGCAVLPAD